MLKIWSEPLVKPGAHEPGAADSPALDELIVDPKPLETADRLPPWTPLRARLIACDQAMPASSTWVSKGSANGSKVSSTTRPAPYTPSTTSAWPSLATSVTLPLPTWPLAIWAVASDVRPASSASAESEAVDVDVGRIGSSSGGRDSSVRRQDGPPASITVPPRPT